MAVDLLIDGDPYVYACGAVGETREYHVRPLTGRGIKRFESASERDEWMARKGLTKDDVRITMTQTPRPFAHVRQAFRMAMEGMREHVANYFEGVGLRYGRERLFLTGGTNYRLDVATIRGYKANRTSPKPIHYRALRTYMIEEMGAVLTDGIEADDAIAMRQWRDWKRGGDAQPGTILCSIDKDLDQVPGLHYNSNHKEVYHLSLDEARMRFWRQCLTGDTVDNIPGCRMIGPAKALALLPEPVSDWDAYCTAAVVYAANMKKYPEHHAPHTDPVAALHENAKLLYMLRHPKDEWRPPEEP